MHCGQEAVNVSKNGGKKAIASLLLRDTLEASKLSAQESSVKKAEMASSQYPWQTASMTNLSRKFSVSADNEYQSIRPKGPTTALALPPFGSLPPCATRSRQLKAGAELKAPRYSLSSVANTGLFCVRSTARLPR